jgi:hypothetical protein
MAVASEVVEETIAQLTGEEAVADGPHTSDGQPGHEFGEPAVCS